MIHGPWRKQVSVTRSQFAHPERITRPERLLSEWVEVTLSGSASSQWQCSILFAFGSAVTVCVPRMNYASWMAAERMGGRDTWRKRKQPMTMFDMVRVRICGHSLCTPKELRAMNGCWTNGWRWHLAEAQAANDSVRYSSRSALPWLLTPIIVRILCAWRRLHVEF